MSYLNRHWKNLNIFLLDKNPYTCARYYCDKHVSKMALEMTMLLNTYMRSYLGIVIGYNSTQVGHFCYHWITRRYHNVAWTFHLALGLFSEFEKRFGKKHSCEELVKAMLLIISDDKNIKGLDIVPRLMYNRCTEVKGLHRIISLPIEKLLEDELLIQGFSSLIGVSQRACNILDPVEMHRYNYWICKKEFAKWNHSTPSPHWWNEEYMASILDRNINTLPKDSILRNRIREAEQHFEVQGPAFEQIERLNITTIEF